MEDIEIKVIKIWDKKYFDGCLQIARSYAKELSHYEGILMSHYVVCAIKEEKVLGYISLVDDNKFSGDLYMLQVAVDKEERGKGIANVLLDYVLHHSKGFTRVACDIKWNNEKSIKVHEKAGFTRKGNCESGRSYRYVVMTENIKDNDYIEYTDEKEKE